jgi:hypothetical protein
MTPVFIYDMTTVSFQVDNETKSILDDLAKTEGVSRSDVLRRMLQWQKFLLGIKDLQTDLRGKIRQSRLETEDDFERFLG